jgi:hypothetical protein
MKLFALLVLVVRFALHRRPPDGPGSTTDGPDPNSPSQRSGSINAGEGVDSAVDATLDEAGQGRPTTGPVSQRDIHGQVRQGERDVDVDYVWENGDLYIQEDGQMVRILENGDGTYSVVVRDPSNPSGEPTTVIEDMTEKQVQSRIDRGFWE